MKLKKVDEVEAMEKTQETLANLIFALQVVALGVSLIQIGFEAGVKRGWESKVETCEDHPDA